MKLTALIFCIALVPFVAAQAAEEEVGYLAQIQGWWTDLTGSPIDTDRLRQDFIARMDQARNLVEQGLNKSREVMEEFSVDIPDADLPSGQEVADEITSLFNNLQTALNEQINKLRELEIDPFNLNEDQDNRVEPQPNPEAEPTRETPESKPWWSMW